MCTYANAAFIDSWVLVLPAHTVFVKLLTRPRASQKSPFQCILAPTALACEPLQAEKKLLRDPVARPRQRGHCGEEYVMITDDGYNFALPSVHQHPEECATMIARDIMTRKVCTIHPEASAQEAAQLLDQMRISGLPVVDEDGKIIGIITEADIISKVDREGLGVAEIMSNEVIFVSEETSVSEIAMLLTDRKIKRVPVVNDGKLVGIVSRADIVHAVAQGHLIIRPW